MATFNYESINNYTLTGELFSKFTENYDYKYTKTDRKITNNKKVSNRYITPKQKDKLFWCFYILYKSKEDYDLIKDKHFQIEKDMKFDFVNIIRNNKNLLKKYKLRRNEVEDILINESKIDVKVFFMFCIYYEINIMFINNNFYYEFDEVNDDNLKIIRIINGDYCIDTENENLDFYRSNYCEMENIDKYVKSMSSYKLDDLQKMCLKLDINILNDNDKKKTKQELYDNILLQLA